jgi:hypothetical protein
MPTCRTWRRRRSCRDGRQSSLFHHEHGRDRGHYVGWAGDHWLFGSSKRYAWHHDLVRYSRRRQQLRVWVGALERHRDGAGAVDKLERDCCNQSFRWEFAGILGADRVGLLLVLGHGWRIKRHAQWIERLYWTQLVLRGARGDWHGEHYSGQLADRGVGAHAERVRHAHLGIDVLHHWRQSDRVLFRIDRAQRADFRAQQ